MHEYLREIWIKRDRRTPVIIPEGGTDEDYNACSNYSMDPVDKMTLPFSGIAGYNSWPGYTPLKFTHENDNVTMAPHIYDMWKTTIRTKNHMNGDGVIGTLSEGWGGWSHGMQQTFLKFPKWAGITHYKPNLLELQYYISSNRNNFTGYVKNRAYNVRTRGCPGVTFPNIKDVGLFYYPHSISWNDSRIPTNKRLVVTGLKKGEYYKIHWYSFKYAYWLDDYCLKAKNGEVELEYPKLTNSSNGTSDNPVLWFVAERSDCNKNKSVIVDDSTEIIPDYLDEYKQSIIYPNPFEDSFTINSLQDDVFILQSLAGTIIGQYKVGNGETKITTNLSRGLYIGRLQKQGQTFKIVKQ